MHCGRCTVLWNEKKLLPCLFLLDVLCSFRKNEEFAILRECLSCPHYREFKREMENEEEQFFEEVNQIRKYGYPKKFDVPRGSD